MKTKRKTIIRRIVCNVLIITTMLTTIYGTNLLNMQANATGSTSTQSEKEVNSDDSEVARLNSTTDIVEMSYLMTPCTTLLSNDDIETISVQESVVEETKKEVVEVDVPIVAASPSENVQSEIVMSDEEKWTSITYVSEPYTMYCNVLTSYLNIRTSATTGIDNIIGGLNYADEVTVIGHNTYDSNWSVIKYKEKEAFVYSEYLSEWVDTSLKVSSYENPEWDGVTKLNAVNGKIQGPSGTETYYNLKMDRCIYYMNQLGYDYEVWVRDDGVKMFGDYIMIAANLDIRPKGTLVETSLGMGIVVDTGEFVNWDPTGIDIAVTW